MYLLDKEFLFEVSFYSLFETTTPAVNEQLIEMRKELFYDIIEETYFYSMFVHIYIGAFMRLSSCREIV